MRTTADSLEEAVGSVLERLRRGGAEVGIYIPSRFLFGFSKWRRALVPARIVDGASRLTEHPFWLVRRPSSGIRMGTIHSSSPAQRPIIRDTLAVEGGVERRLAGKWEWPENLLSLPSEVAYE